MNIDRQELEELVHADDIRTVYDKYWASQDLPVGSPEREEDFRAFSKTTVVSSKLGEFANFGRGTILRGTQILTGKKSAKHVLAANGINLSKNSLSTDPSLCLDIGELTNAVTNDPDLVEIVEDINCQLIISMTIALLFRNLESYEDGFKLLAALDEIEFSEACLDQEVFNEWIICCIGEDGRPKDGRERPTEDQCYRILKEMKKRGVPITGQTYYNLVGVLHDGITDFRHRHNAEFNLMPCVGSHEFLIGAFEAAESFVTCSNAFKSILEHNLAKPIGLFSNWLGTCENAEQDSIVFDFAYETFGSQLSTAFLMLYMDQVFDNPERFGTMVANLYKSKFLSQMFPFESFDKIKFGPEDSLKAANKIAEACPDVASTYDSFAANPNAKKYSGEFGTLVKIYDFLLSIAKDLPGVKYIEPKELE